MYDDYSPDLLTPEYSHTHSMYCSTDYYTLKLKTDKFPLNIRSFMHLSLYGKCIISLMLVDNYMEMRPVIYRVMVHTLQCGYSMLVKRG